MKVSSWPGCPAVGASCRVCRISRLSCSSGGITRCPAFCHSFWFSWIEYVTLHSFKVVRYFSCASWTFDRKEMVVGVVVLMRWDLLWHCSQLSTYFVTHSSASGHQ